MTHDERRRARKAAEAKGTIRVTWRRVTEPFVGWSGFGPLGLSDLVYVEARGDGLCEFGWNRGGLREAIGTRGNRDAAREACGELFEDALARKRLQPYIDGYPEPMIDTRRLRIANGTATERERREVAAEDRVVRRLRAEGVVK